MPIHKVTKKIFLTLTVSVLIATLLIYIVYMDRFQYPSHWISKFYKPISEEIRSNSTNLEFYNLSSPLHQDLKFECVSTSTVPSVLVCLYPIDKDIYVSKYIKDTGKWESDITELFLKILRADPTSVFLDLGTNIGYYSLLAAKAGHLVVSVEPNIDSILRLHRAVELENLRSKIIVLKNAVSDKRTVVALRKSVDNQGDTRIEMEVKKCQGSCPTTVTSIILNDLTYLIYDLTIISTNWEEETLYDKLTFSRQQREGFMFQSSNPSELLGHYKKAPSKVVMKIDTQGFEHLIFDNPNFFFDQNGVTHIFMEWVLMAGIQPLHNKTGDVIKVEAMIRFLSERRFRPFSTTHPRFYESLNTSTWHSWPVDILWCHDSQRLVMENLGFKNWVG